MSLAKKLKEVEGYVLITCSKPNAQGEMMVEMNHEGDDNLIAYLLESAQMMMNQTIEEASDA